MADLDYDQKLRQMQQYVPFLEKVMEKLKSSSDQHSQIKKIQILQDLLKNTEKRLKMESLIKCENVLKKLHSKFEKISTSSGIAPSEEEKSIYCIDLSGPASPPPQPVEEVQPVEIPTERRCSPLRFSDTKNEFLSRAYKYKNKRTSTKSPAWLLKDRTCSLKPQAKSEQVTSTLNIPQKTEALVERTTYCGSKMKTRKEDLRGWLNQNKTVALEDCSGHKNIKSFLSTTVFPMNLHRNASICTPVKTPSIPEVLKSPPLTDSDISQLLEESMDPKPQNVSIISEIGTRRTPKVASSTNSLDIVRKKFAMITKNAASQKQSSTPSPTSINCTQSVPKLSVPTERLALKYNPHPRVNRNICEETQSPDVSDTGAHYKNDKTSPNVNVLPSVNLYDPRLRKSSIPSLLALPISPPDNIGQSTYMRQNDNKHTQLRTNLSEFDSGVGDSKQKHFYSRPTSSKYCSTERHPYINNKFQWNKNGNPNNGRRVSTHLNERYTGKLERNINVLKSKGHNSGPKLNNINKQYGQKSTNKSVQMNDSVVSQKRSTEVVLKPQACLKTSKIQTTFDNNALAGKDSNSEKYKTMELIRKSEIQSFGGHTSSKEQTNITIDKQEKIINKSTERETTDAESYTLSTAFQSNLDKLYRGSTFSGCDFPKTKTNFKIPKKQPPQKGTVIKEDENENKSSVAMERTDKKKMKNPQKSIESENGSKDQCPETKQTIQESENIELEATEQNISELPVRNILTTFKTEDNIKSKFLKEEISINLKHQMRVKFKEKPESLPRRILKRRCTMMTFGSAPEIDKEKVHSSKALMLEDVGMRKRKSRLIADMYQKTDDNCTVSTQNIITGKRRTRASINFNEVQHTRAIFGIKATQDFKKPIATSPRISNNKKATGLNAVKKRDENRLAQSVAASKFITNKKDSSDVVSVAVEQGKDKTGKHAKTCLRTASKTDIEKEIADNSVAACQFKNAHKEKASKLNVQAAKDKILYYTKALNVPEAIDRTPDVDDLNTSVAGTKCAIDSMTISASSTLEEERQDLLENFVQDMLKPNANITHIFSLLEQILTKEKLDLVKSIIESATKETGNESTTKTQEEIIELADNNVKLVEHNKNSGKHTELTDSNPVVECSKETAVKKIRRRNELDRLNDDIRDMFISEGVLTATGRRMCTLVAKSQTGKDIPSLVNQLDKNCAVVAPVTISKEKSSLTKSPDLNEKFLKNIPHRMRKVNVVLSPIDLRRSTRSKVDKPDVHEESSISSNFEQSELSIEHNSDNSRNGANSEEDSEDEMDLASLVKRTKTSADRKDELKNININWHSQSKYIKWCVICKVQLQHCGIHYKMNHQEHYASRFTPMILQQLKEGKLSQPLFGVSKRGQLLWFYRCPFCLQHNRTIFTSWREHFITHTGEYFFECSWCHKPGNKLNKMEKHISFSCPGATLVRKNIVQSQTIIKAHICHLCNFTQMGRENLERHYVLQHDCTSANAKMFGYSVNLFNVDNAKIVDEKTANTLEVQAKNSYKNDLLIIDDDDENFMKTEEVVVDEIKVQVEQIKKVIDSVCETQTKARDGNLSITDRLCQRLKDFQEKNSGFIKPALEIANENILNETTQTSDTSNLIEGKSVGYFRISPCFEEIADKLPANKLKITESDEGSNKDDDDDEENWEDIEIIETFSEQKEYKPKKVDLFPKFQKVCGGPLGHKSNKAKRHFYVKKKRPTSTNVWNSTENVVQKAAVCSLDSSRPAITAIADFLADSPSNDPIDLNPELAPNEPLQDLSDISSLLDTNFNSTDIENLTHAIDNTASAICFNTDNQQTSIEDALDFISEQQEQFNGVIPPSAIANINCQSKSSSQTVINHIQNVGYSFTPGTTYKFYCLLNHCTFLYSSNIVGLEYHYLNEHPDVKWNGYCITCKKQVEGNADMVAGLMLSQEIKHVLEKHTSLGSDAVIQIANTSQIEATEKPILKLRRLSGDCLSATCDSDSSSVNASDQTPDLVPLLNNKPKSTTLPKALIEQTSSDIRSELQFENSDKAVTTANISNPAEESQIPKILTVCSLNKSGVEELWPEYSCINSLARDDDKNREMQRADSPGPIVVSETVPIAQATSGNFLITQTVSAQYGSNEMGTTSTQVGFNIAISNTPKQRCSENTGNTNHSIPTIHPVGYGNKTPLHLPYRCLGNGCKFQTRVPVAMADHLNFHERRNFSSQREYLQCCYCMHSADNISDYMRHVEASHKLSAHPIDSMQRLDANTTNTNESGNFHRSNNTISYKEHLEETIQEIISYTGVADEKLYQCVINDCGAALTPLTFQSHVSHHLLESSANSGNTSFKCPHCSAVYQRIAGIKAHIKCHIRHNYFCYICTETASNPGQIMKHFAEKHWQTLNLHTSVLLKLSSNMYRDELIYYVAHSEKLNEIELQQFGEKLIVDWLRKKASSKTHFKPNEIALLPIQPIFQTEKYCSECMYKTKVRTNLLRHLQIHNTKESSCESQHVAIVDPVNPMPCLNAKMRHFDKMTNLASSSVIIAPSNANTENNDTIAEKRTFKVNYAYVPENKLFTCGVKECKYLTISDDIFRSHLNALHANIQSYCCPFCNEEICKRMLSVERVLQHLRYHGHKLFQCDECNYVHYMKNVVGRHIREGHPFLQVNLLTHSRATEGSKTGVTVQKLMKGNKYKSGIKDTPDVGGASGKMKQKWGCNFCEYKTVSQAHILAHCQTHDNLRDRKLEEVYYKIQLETATIDTKPLWQRDDPKRIRHIRGILMENEEESEQHRKFISDIIDDEEDSVDVEKISNQFANKQVSINDAVKDTRAPNLYLGLFELGCYHCSYESNFGNLRKMHWVYSHSKNDRWAEPYMFQLYTYLKCAYCFNFKGNCKELQLHLKIVHKNNSFCAADPNASGIVCGYCNYSCMSTSHLLRHHSSAEHDVNDYKNFTTQKLKTILTLGHPETCYRCESCGKLSANALSIANHVREHAGSTNEISFKELSNVIIYKCHECDYTSVCEKETLRHMIDHYDAFKICRFCNQVQTTFSAYMQHCYSKHRKEIQNFHELYTLSQIKKYVLDVLYIFPNGLVVNKKNLQLTEFSKDDEIYAVYEDICKIAKQPPIPRLSIAQLVARKFNESQQLMAGMPGKVSRRRNTVAVGNIRKKRKAVVDYTTAVGTCAKQMKVPSVVHFAPQQTQDLSNSVQNATLFIQPVGMPQLHSSKKMSERAHTTQYTDASNANEACVGNPIYGAEKNKTLLFTIDSSNKQYVSLNQSKPRIVFLPPKERAASIAIRNESLNATQRIIQRRSTIAVERSSNDAVTLKTKQKFTDDSLLPECL